MLVKQGWNCHTWGPMAKYAIKTLEKARTGTLRKVSNLCSTEAKHFSNERVHAEGFLTQGEVNILSRLKFYSRLLISAPECIWAMIRGVKEDEKCWSSLFRKDVMWLKDWARCDPPFKGLAEEDEMFEACSNYAKSEPKVWKSVVKRAGKKAEMQKTVLFEFRRWEELCCPSQPRGKEDKEEKGKKENCEQLHQCPICVKTFANDAGLCLHLWTAHKKRAYVRRQLEGSICPACLCQHHTRQRLVKHVNTVNSCFEAIKLFPAVHTEEEEAKLSKAAAEKDKGTRRNRMPAYKVEGPLGELKTRLKQSKGDYQVDTKAVKFLGPSERARTPKSVTANSK